jgi:atypical dual specificity phosphatase
LHDISLDLADRGLYVLHVPNTIERRMFMRALCGPRPVNFSVQGQASYDKKPIDDSHCPTTVQAGAQLLMLTVVGYIGSGFAEQTLSRAEQRVATTKLLRQAGYPEMLQRLDHDMTSLDAAERRVLEILRASLQAAKVLVLEEPLAGLPMDQQARIVQVLRRQSQERALLILLQEGAPTEGLTDRVGWLIEGRTSPHPPQAQPPPAPAPAPVPDVPVPAGQKALAEPSPALPPAPAEPAPVPVPMDSPAVRVVGRGPRGFQWLRVGQLAGMPAPGLAHDLAYDLHLIANAGISHLITLTHDAISEKDLSPHGLTGILFPIVDMDVPTEENTEKLCARVDELIKKGGAVGFHCKAGLGRTGTMLACQLIWEGKPATQALALCRSIEPGWIQSEKQLLFLEKFEGWLRTHRQK